MRIASHEGCTFVRLFLVGQNQTDASGCCRLLMGPASIHQQKRFKMNMFWCALILKTVKSKLQTLPAQPLVNTA